MRCLSIIYLFFLCVNAIAANPLEEDAPTFNIKQANQAFDHINLQLSTQNLNQHDLNTAIDTLSGYTEQAEQCMSDAQKKLTNLELLIQQGSNAADKNTTGADLIYLSREKTNMASRLAECRLFSIRAKEAIEAYKTTIAHLTQEEVLTRTMPLWGIIIQLVGSPPVEIFNAILKVQLPAALETPILWIILVCSALIVSPILLLRVRKTRFAKHYLHIKPLRVSHVLLLSLCLLAGTIFIYLFVVLPDTPNPLLELSQEIFFYLSALTLIIFFFKMKRVKALFYSYSIDKNFFRFALLFFLSFYALASIGSILGRELNLNDLLLQLIHSLFFLSMLATGIYFVYYFCDTHKHFSLIKYHKHLIRRLGMLTLVACAVITILGYHALAIRIASSGLTTFIIIFVTIFIMQGINKLYFISSHQQTIQTRIMKYFGYKQDQIFTEFLILKTTAQVIIIAFSLFLVLRSWGFATYYLESAYGQVLYGIHLANTTIYPTRIILGIIVYCLLYLLFRCISTAISRHQQFEDEEETQVAIASIFTYLGFTVALISALLVAGFNFTGLAIIAGALSVGIGLGLQSIVNNFVSGLILLIEKPIKPGDRINIDGVEGFVKKIRVRSTHIITPSYDDIIVPNSDLITHRVTNYVYSNKQSSINCDINVPLGSDTKRVRDLLLEAAHSNDDVIKSGRNKPYVLFRSFGEKALLFQLCCLIKDVNIKLLVQSDLNFAIDQLLRENNIE